MASGLLSLFGPNTAELLFTSVSSLARNLRRCLAMPHERNLRLCPLSARSMLMFTRFARGSPCKRSQFMAILSHSLLILCFLTSVKHGHPLRSPERFFWNAFVADAFRLALTCPTSERLGIESYPELPASKAIEASTSH